jgi:hypothetical protein
MRKRHAIGIAAAMVVLAPHDIAMAQSPTASANAVMPGCRSFISGDNRDLIGQGHCAGMVDSIFYFGATHFGICSPSGVTVGQALRVAVRYIDQRPERMHENFRNLALEALQQAWPCRR